MIYNTNQKKLILPEYGRSIQNMVDYALTIEDRAERQRCAETIVRIMRNMFPEQQDMPDYEHKFWDHLAIMADFNLDIDYPVEIIRPESVHRRPDTVPYSNGYIRYRHYGRYIPDLIQECANMPEGEERDSLVKLIAVQMKKEQLLWNKEGLGDERILSDLTDFSEGRLQVSEEEVKLASYKVLAANQQPSSTGSGKKKKKKKKNNNNSII